MSDTGLPEVQIDPNESYLEMQARHQKEYGEFPVRFAFRQVDIDKIAEDWECKQEELVGLPGGAVVKSENFDAYMSMTVRMVLEKSKLLEDDEKFVEALKHELGNHEYGYTWDTDPAVESLGLDPKKLTEREEKLIAKASSEWMREYETWQAECEAKKLQGE